MLVSGILQFLIFALIMLMSFRMTRFGRMYHCFEMSQIMWPVIFFSWIVITILMEVERGKSDTECGTQLYNFGIFIIVLTILYFCVVLCLVTPYVILGVYAWFRGISRAS